MCWIFLLKDNIAIGIVLPYFCKMISTQFGTPIQKFRVDNAMDYFNNHLHQFFQQEGIVHESSCIDTPQQNGIAKRKLRHLLNVARATNVITLSLKNSMSPKMSPLLNLNPFLVLLRLVPRGRLENMVTKALGMSFLT